MEKEADLVVLENRRKLDEMFKFLDKEFKIIYVTIYNSKLRKARDWNIMDFLSNKEDIEDFKKNVYKDIDLKENITVDIYYTKEDAILVYSNQDVTYTEKETKVKEIKKWLYKYNKYDDNE